MHAYSESSLSQKLSCAITLKKGGKMKKLLFTILFLSFYSQAYAQNFNLIAICSNPMIIEGELFVSVSKDRKEAKVSLSGLFDFPTEIVSIGGPIMTFDYSIDERTERVIIAVDGLHEIHIKHDGEDYFQKLGDLQCQMK